jgi:methionine-gamma-lyase
MNKDKFKFDTMLIHGGSDHVNPENALNPPIFQTSTFVFHDTDHIEKVMSFESSDCVYTRGNNPTLKILEKRMAILENGVASVAFASGMAAISSVLFSFLKPGDDVLVHRTLYGSSYNMTTKVLKRYDVGNRIVNLTNLSTLEDELSDGKVKVIYFETPSNPNLEIVDIEEVSKIAKKYNVKVVVDNTFASPYLQKPLDLGADVVVHSATKYICGHGDVVGGIAIAKDEDYIMELKFDFMSEFGGVMSPFNAWLLIRGLKTLSIRMDRHMENAMKIAKYLEAHEKVVKVYYPGLPSFPGHEVATKQMKGYGAMISFEVVGGFENAKKVLNSVELAKIAVSLGDCETLIEFPASMTHRGYNQEQLELFGLSREMLRISVGLEDVSDIIADIELALSKV